jgi:hypothetical protein
MSSRLSNGPNGHVVESLYMPTKVSLTCAHWSDPNGSAMVAELSVMVSDVLAVGARWFASCVGARTVGVLSVMIACGLASMVFGLHCFIVGTLDMSC